MYAAGSFVALAQAHLKTLLDLVSTLHHLLQELD
jgi:hypothetical protein